MNGIFEQPIHTFTYSSSSSTALATTSSTTQAIVIAQFKQDVMGDIGKGFNHFYQTGQLWALLIGVVLGYLVKSITSS